MKSFASNYDTPASFSTEWISDIDELSVMADHLYQAASDLDYIEHSNRSGACETVFVRSQYGFSSASRPEKLAPTTHLRTMADSLQSNAMLMITSTVTREIVERVPPMVQHIRLIGGAEISIYESCEDALSHKDMATSGFYLIRQELAAIVWTDNAKLLISEGRKCDKALSLLLWDANDSIQTLWQFESDQTKKTDNEEIKVTIQELSGEQASDSESQTVSLREQRLVWPMIVALTFIFLGWILGKLTSSNIQAVIRDGTLYQLTFLLYLPLACCLSAFFISIIVVSVFQLVGPISQMEANSKSHSGTRIECRLQPEDLPHITIQCPVYKEDLSEVLEPTFQSVRQAIATYELQGGTASMLVNDDGMRLLESADQQDRKTYYRRHGIAWTARPPHGENGYSREGAFKKASNLNFGLRASLEIEKVLHSLSLEHNPSASSYETALNHVVQASRGRLWAGGDLGLGDLILLIDADTRIPKDCFLDAVKEFHESPCLAILQHASGVLQVAHNFWETGLAHFTRSNYFGSRYVVSGGDTTPFFGHNAFLRFSALNDIAESGHDNLLKWWSEDHVSEDFEISLKLLSAGFSSRLVSYSNNEFLEGVSLTVYDEISRWEKYAFGVSELTFNPVTKWVKAGPFTPLFRNFLSSNMDMSAKCSSLFYMGTYFGIGLNWLMCLINYFLIGWFPMMVRQYYVDCLQILIAVTVIFSLKDAFVGPFVRYRLKEVALGRGLLDSLKYFILVSLFFQGISMHVSKCLIWHLCGVKMTWGSTSKSVDDSATFRDDLPLIWRRYKFIYILVVLLTSTIVVLGFAVPETWRIKDIKALLPLVWMLFWHASIPLLMHNRSFLSEFYRRRSL